MGSQNLLLAFDLLPYAPAAGACILFLIATWGFVKRGRKAQKEDIQKAVNEATAKLRQSLADAQQTNTILENQNRILKEQDVEKDNELEACEKKCSEVTRFNFRLQGDIDELERRVSELESGLSKNLGRRR